MQIGLGHSVSRSGGRRREKEIARGRFSHARARLEDRSHVTATSGTVTELADGYALGAGSRVTIGGLGPVTGPVWVSTTVTKVEETSGSYRARFLSPTHQPEGTRQRGATQVWKFPDVAGSQTLDVVTGTGFGGTLHDVQIHDMADVLAMPADVYVAAGQSNMAAAGNGFGVDAEHDGWTDRRALYVPGADYAGYGALRGVPTALAAPLQMNGASFGVSPAVAFGQRVVARTPKDRAVVIVAAAWGGTSLVGPDAPWNPGGTDPFAFDHMMTCVADAMAALPAGSALKGVLWAQGESDRDPGMIDTYPRAFAGMRAVAEAGWGAGQLPWFILLPPTDSAHVLQSYLVDTQRAMDSASGAPQAQPMVHAVERPTGFMEDVSHVTAAGQRIGGARLAERLFAEGYL